MVVVGCGNYNRAVVCPSGWASGCARPLAAGRVLLRPQLRRPQDLPHGAPVPGALLRRRQALAAPRRRRRVRGDGGGHPRRVLRLGRPFRCLRRLLGRERLHLKKKKKKKTKVHTRKTKAHTRTQAHRASKDKASLINASCTWAMLRGSRAPHFTPQHWLLCHMGLY